MKLDNKIGDLSRNADVLVACGVLILLVGVTFFGVIMCYRLGDPLIRQEEVQLALTTWVVFLGGRYAFVCGNYVAIDVIVEMFPEKLQKLPNVLIAAVAAIILCYAGYQGVRCVMQMVRCDRVTNILETSYSLIHAPLPIGCLTVAAQVCLNTYRDLTGKGEEV